MQCTSYLHTANSLHSTRSWPVLRPQEEVLWLVEMKVQGKFFLLPYCCVTRKPPLVFVNQTKAPTTKEFCHLLITTNIHVKRMTQLEGNTEKYAGGINATALARCVVDRSVGILSVASVDIQSLYRLR
jgi:hypothetical protein